MKFEINDSPELTMAEITKLLFNQRFLADVQFVVDGKIIFAHSLELMKRSTVFQKELAATVGEMKLIPINNVSYDHFYQFLRFIYTDDYEVDNSNALELLKLAKRYKVTKFQNQIICVISGVEINLSLYEYCLLENDHFYLRRAEYIVQNKLKECLSSNRFLQLQPVVVAEILKSEYSNVSELEIFAALTRWIDRNSRCNEIGIHERREYYQNLIQLIRFPVIPANARLRFISNCRYLFKESDLASFNNEYAKTINLNQTPWNNQKRILYPELYAWTFENNPTIFTVSQEMWFIGIRFGGCRYKQTSVELIITEKNYVTNHIETLTLNCTGRLDWSFHQFNLGQSIRLKPEMEYTLKLKWPKTFGHFLMWSRKENVDIFTNISPHLVHFKEKCANVFDLYFEVIE